MQFLRILRATFLTLKRTRAFWLAIAAPLFILCFRVLIFLFTDTKSSWNVWIEGNYSFWFGIILLLALSLDIALLVDIDRSAQSWKYLFALPISRISVYVAKFIVALVLTFMSGLILLGSSLVAGYLFAVTKPQIGFALASPDLSYYLEALALETIASFLIIAIYTWISMRTKNFILPICLAIAGTVMNIVAYSNVTFQKFSPWMYGLDMERILAKTPQTQPYFGWPLPVILAISIAGAILVTLFGCVEFARRDIF